MFTVRTTAVHVCPARWQPTTGAVGANVIDYESISAVRIPPGRGSAALVGHGRGRLGGGLRVQVPAARLDRAEGRVQLVDQRDAGRDVELRDLRVPDAVQILDQGAQRVAVRDDQHRLAAGQGRDDRVLPVRQHPVHY